MLLLTLLLGLLFYAIYKRQQQMTTFKRLRIPGPRPNFILGNSIDIAREGTNAVFPKWTKKYGPIVGFYLGGHPLILTTDFELMRRVLVKDFHKFSNKSELVKGGIHPVPQLRKMLVWTQDNAWRRLRASMSPSFSAYKLSAMEPLMMTSIDKMISELEDKAKSGDEFNVKPYIAELTFSSAVKCIFGLDFSLRQMTKESKNFLEATLPRLEKSILAILMMLFPSLIRIAYPLRVYWERIRFYMLWSPEGSAYDMTKNILQIRKDLQTQSVDFLQLLMNTKKVQTITDNDLEMSSEDVAQNNNSLSKDASENISEDEIVSNALLFLLASFETTSVTLQFCLHNLINHQNVQDELRSELRKAVERIGKPITSSTLSEVPLLNRIVKETLRMFPPASPFMTRVANEDYEYKDIVIPKGTTVFIGVSSIHNDPQFWPEPEEFRPQRFESDYDKLSFLTFGHGPRNCIGMRFAYMEAQLALAKLILEYRFEPGPSTEKKLVTVETFATLIPKNGVFCKVTRLEK
ncbi:cytochrome P450 3A24-like isoform X1 [Bradysia coprophila]|uniref:cytochrome P450 3A24-like isoform X1 n=1 Tax=Bradysia coprophila TaxID=38358 RepID=UPI00187D77FA|nr:cytochrome P450 3A24-like isoform X1 [Bradysia coprophila]